MLQHIKYLMTKSKKLKENLDFISRKDISEEQKAVENILKTSSLIRHEIGRICELFEISKSQYFVLKILCLTYPTALARGEIIDKMIEPSPDVTRLIDKLEKRELVKRFRSQDDARRSMNRITQDGIELLSKVETRIREYFQHIGEVLCKRECVDLSDLCKRISKGVL